MPKTFSQTLVFIGFCLLLGTLVADCSVQSPQYGADASAHRSQNRSKARAAEKRPNDWQSFRHRVVSMDYLRPVKSIKHPDLYVYKEKRRLYVLDGDVLVRDYPIGLGPHPRGDKEKRGDGRTPEGRFFVCVKNSRSRFGKSLGISYPDPEHAKRALFEGLISVNAYRNIVLAKESKKKPPWDTALGGEIFVHGGGAQADWTNGCVALYNSDMDELFKIARIGTPVTIRP